MTRSDSAAVAIALAIAGVMTYYYDPSPVPPDAGPVSAAPNASARFGVLEDSISAWVATVPKCDHDQIRRLQIAYRDAANSVRTLGPAAASDKIKAVKVEQPIATWLGGAIRREWAAVGVTHDNEVLAEFYAAVARGLTIP